MRVTSSGCSTGAGQEAAGSDDIVVNINEKELAEQAEALEEVLGSLDGQLSLKNATIYIDVD